MSDLFGPFGGMRTPSPPPELRGRAMRAARNAAQEPRAAPGWSSFDLAWVGALVVLLACHASLSPHASSIPGVRPLVREAPQSIAARERDQDWLTLGLRLDTSTHQTEQPGLTLGQALQAAS